MLGTLAVPVVAAQNSQKTSYIYDAEKVDELIDDLKDVIASYNEAMREGNLEDAEDYVIETFEIYWREAIRSQF